MPNNRYDKLDYEKQRLILNTSLKEFMDRSYEAASINQISKNAGLSAGALYYYFDNKEDLLHTTIDFALEDLNLTEDLIKDMFDKLGYWSTIKEIIRKRLDFTKRHPEKMRFLQRLIITKDTIEINAKNRVLKLFRIIFDYGYTHGYIKNTMPKDLLFEIHLALITSINKWELEYYRKDVITDTYEDLIDEYLITIRNAIGVW